MGPHDGCGCFAGHWSFGVHLREYYVQWKERSVVFESEGGSYLFAILSACHFIYVMKRKCDMMQQTNFDILPWTLFYRGWKKILHTDLIWHTYLFNIDRVRLDLIATTSAIQPVKLPLIHLVPFFSVISCSAGQCVQIGPEQRSAPGLQLGAI